MRGCTAIVMLDESQFSMHTYADLELVAMDVFTCGKTNPMDIWDYVRTKMVIEEASIRNVHRFQTQTAAMA